MAPRIMGILALSHSNSLALKGKLSQFIKWSRSRLFGFDFLHFLVIFRKCWENCDWGTRSRFH